MTAAAAKRLRIALLATVFSMMVHPSLAQQFSPPPDTVLPPPPSEEPSPPRAIGAAPRPPALAAPSPISSAGPFAPRPASPFAPSPAQDPSGQPSDSILNLWGIYDWFSTPQEFFAYKEVDILKPHLKAALTDSVAFPNGSQSTVQPPTAQLNWTAAARIEVGWFLQPNLGFFGLTYRGFADDGRQTVSSQNGTPFALRTRLDVNEAIFDYGAAPYSFAPRWFVNGRIGVAAAWLYFDNQAMNAVQALLASNYFLGAGPHVRADVWREFNLVPGLSLFAQPELTVLIGEIQQRYQDTEIPAIGPSVSGFIMQRKTQTVPVFTLHTGLSYAPASLRHWRFMVGYEFEDWWSVGQIPGEASRGQLRTNGVFLQAFATF